MIKAETISPTDWVGPGLILQTELLLHLVTVCLEASLLPCRPEAAGLPGKVCCRLVVNWLGERPVSV